MATVAGARGERMLLRRRRLPLGDLTNLSSSTSGLTRLKPAAGSKLRTSPSAGSSTSSIGSCASTAPRTRCTPPPPPPPLSAVAVIKGNDKATRDVQSACSHGKKIKKISKPKEKTGDVLPGTSSPPSKKTRKIKKISKPKEKTGDVLPGTSSPPSKKTRKIKKISKPKKKTGDVLPGTSSPPSKKTRKVTWEQQPHMEPLDESSDELLPSQDFINERRAYFAEIDAVELVEEFVSSGSDLE